MVRNHHKAIAAASVATIALLSMPLASCKGRTMENMEPTGDTVEVVIEKPDTTAQSQAQL
ncbi:MAG: hypothetical protein NC204_02560 [Candidatus Amulumruptor caecigallinarius]|nr:hypothetical protein [Candidatus Amulumruptor caecigallinarius]